MRSLILCCVVVGGGLWYVADRPASPPAAARPSLGCLDGTDAEAMQACLLRQQKERSQRATIRALQEQGR